VSEKLQVAMEAKLALMEAVFQRGTYERANAGDIFFDNILRIVADPALFSNLNVMSWRSRPTPFG
jgi:hypothetical protein